MQVKIDRLIEGARRAEGVVVIIDVFRAFTLECWMYSFGAKLIRPIGKADPADRKGGGCFCPAGAFSGLCSCRREEGKKAGGL